MAVVIMKKSDVCAAVRARAQAAIVAAGSTVPPEVAEALLCMQEDLARLRDGIQWVIDQRLGFCREQQYGKAELKRLLLGANKVEMELFSRGMSRVAYARHGSEVSRAVAA